MGSPHPQSQGLGGQRGPSSHCEPAFGPLDVPPGCQADALLSHSAQVPVCIPSACAGIWDYLCLSCPAAVCPLRPGQEVGGLVHCLGGTHVHRCSCTLQLAPAGGAGEFLCSLISAMPRAAACTPASVLALPSRWRVPAAQRPDRPQV